MSVTVKVLKNYKLRMARNIKLLFAIFLLKIDPKRNIVFFYKKSLYFFAKSGKINKRKCLRRCIQYTKTDINTLGRKKSHGI